MSSTFLFTMPSFLVGAGRTLALGGKTSDYNISPSAEIADGRALACDLAVIGREVGRPLSAREMVVHGKKKKKAG